MEASICKIIKASVTKDNMIEKRSKSEKKALIATIKIKHMTPV